MNLVDEVVLTIRTHRQARRCERIVYELTDDNGAIEVRTEFDRGGVE